MTDLQTMRANVRTDLVVDPNGDIWSNDRIDRYLNEFIGQVYTLLNLDFAELTGTITLVTGTATYDLSTGLTNYGRLISLRLQGRYAHLDEVDGITLENSGVDLTVQNEPDRFFFYGPSTVQLYPTPDGVITTLNARYERSAPVLTDAEEPAWRSEWHFVCERYAHWRCLATQPGFADVADRAWDTYRLAYQEMKADLWERSSGDIVMQNTTETTWP